MNDQEAIEMMTRCAAEMRSLRQQVARLQPKADAYDMLDAVINLLPRKSQGYGEDLVWVLEKRIAEMQKPIDNQP